MKRLLSMTIATILLFVLVPQALAADTPDPIPVIAKEDLSPTPAGFHYYMLICIDSWTDERLKKNPNPTSTESMHTDGLILVTVDEYANRVMLTSFPREILIQRPDGKYGRINNIVPLMSPKTENGGNDGKQGVQMLIDTINSHFDLRIEKYIVMDFTQVQAIVDAIDGVDIALTSHERARIQSFGTLLPSENEDGTTHLKGYQAVLYMRIRAVPTQKYVHSDGKYYADRNDYGRTYRDRTVLSTIAEKLKDITYQEALALGDVILVNTLFTNMTTDDMLDAVDLAMQMRGTPIEDIRIPIKNPLNQNGNEIKPTPSNFSKYKDTKSYSYCEIGYEGMAVLQLNYELNRKALWDFLMGDIFVVVDEE